jgi:hypothetical protein
MTLKLEVGKYYKNGRGGDCARAVIDHIKATLEAKS